MAARKDECSPATLFEWCWYCSCTWESFGHFEASSSKVVLCLGRWTRGEQEGCVVWVWHNRAKWITVGSLNIQPPFLAHAILMQLTCRNEPRTWNWIIEELLDRKSMETPGGNWTGVGTTGWIEIRECKGRLLLKYEQSELLLYSGYLTICWLKKFAELFFFIVWN